MIEFRFVFQLQTKT